MDKPYYPHKPISSIKVLAQTLGIHENLLIQLSKQVDSSYSEFLIKSKGKDRTVYEPKFNLKKLQKRINHRIFEHVNYPDYLQGGIKDNDNKRDYVENALLHCKTKPQHLISLDIKSFYDNIKKDKVKNIFMYFFKFPEDVSSILTELTTYKNKVPQGACTSSYLANLVFFNSEYLLVSSFRQRNITYTRLLDDVTLSSSKLINQRIVTESIKSVIGMFKKHGLKQNNKKTIIENNKNVKGGFQVTGLWIGHAEPKTTRHDRRYIRLMVHTCEKKFANDKYCEEYHILWNKVSGLVAKLARLNQGNHYALRSKMTLILPLYNDIEKEKIIRECKSLLRINNKIELSHGQVDSINKVIGKLGVLSRNNTNLSRVWRRKIRSHFRKIPTKRDVWL